ncbi:hypothetical protein [Rhodococcus qingshengii]|uniref:hypothetical protein n=1 Tax=Rhodococcus qingshengii TaxID=334542 RepID=UPI0030160160
MSANSDEFEDAIARKVSSGTSAFWRQVAAQLARGLVVYAVVALMMQLGVWMFSLSESDPSEISVAMSMEPSMGGGLLGILVGIVTVLHVAAWGAELLSTNDIVGQIRKRYLATTGIAMGPLATFIGMSVLLNGAPERIEFSGIAVAMLSVGVVIISSDLYHLLGTDAPVQRRLPAAERSANIESLTVVADLWRPSAPMTSATRRLHVALDVCAIGAAATLPAILHFLYLGVVDHREINWASTIGGVVLAAGFLTTLALYTVFVSTRLFLGRDFGTAVFIVVMGTLSYLIAILTFTIAVLEAWPNYSIVVARILVGTIALFLPAVLVGWGLSREHARWIPGSTLRSAMHASLVRKIESLRRIQSEAETPTARPGVWARFVRWVDRVTGVPETN